MPSSVSQFDQELRPRKLYQDIAVTIEAWIRTGRYKEGERLPSERDLMKMLGAGRTSIREALFTLDRTGLVTVRNGERATVSRPSVSNVLDGLAPAVQSILDEAEGRRQLQDARCLWESAIARRAARIATKADLLDLEQALTENERALGNAEAFSRTDVAFHVRIAKICGNPLFNNLNATLTTWLTEQRLTSLNAAGQDRIAYECHVRIFEGLRRGDPDAAEAAMEAHLNQVSEAYWNAIERST